MWILCLGILLAMIVVYSNSRTELWRGHELTPNCLLTRYPVVFLTGARSIFYFRRYWNFVPHYLREHGYEVRVWELPWRNCEQRVQACLSALARHQKVHLVGDRSSAELLRELAKHNHPAIASLTMIHAGRMTSEPGIEVFRIEKKNDQIKTFLHRLCLNLHNVFGFSANSVNFYELGLTSYHQFLDLCISLAERDTRCSH